MDDLAQLPFVEPHPVVRARIELEVVEPLTAEALVTNRALDDGGEIDVGRARRDASQACEKSALESTPELFARDEVEPHATATLAPARLELTLRDGVQRSRATRTIESS